MASRTTTITLTVEDRFAAPLKKFAEAMNDGVKASQRAADETDKHTKKQQQLGEALDINRGQTRLVVGELANLAGVGPQAAQGMELLAHHASTTAIALVGVVEVVKMGQQAINDHVAALKADAAALAQSGTDLTTYTVKTRELRIETALLTEAEELLSKGIVGAAQNFARTVASMDAVAAAELRVAEAARAAAVAGLDSNFKQIDAIKTDGQRAIALMNLAESYAALEFPGKKWAELTAQQQSASIAYADSIIRLRTEQRQLGEQMLITSDDFMQFQDAVTGAARATKLMLDAASQVQDEMRTGSRAEAAAEVGRRVEESWQSAQSAARAYQAEAAQIAKTNAELTKQFNTEGAAAIAVYGEKAAAAYNMIANSALSAADKVRVLQMWESKLPSNIKQAIDIYLATHGDALLMRLLGGGSGPGGGKGNQQGDEYGFTLEGENFNVREAYMRQYGDYGRANDAWQRDHRAELADKGVTGYGQPNTETGQTYDYGPDNGKAMGMHELVSSRRTITVGERGPERVDVTPGGGNGGGNGANVTVNFSSFLPMSEYQMQQAVRQIKKYMANDGA